MHETVDGITYWMRDRWLDSGKEDGVIERRLEAAPVELIAAVASSPPSPTQPADGTNSHTLQISL